MNKGRGKGYEERGWEAEENKREPRQVFEDSRERETETETRERTKAREKHLKNLRL